MSTTPSASITPGSIASPHRHRIRQAGPGSRLTQPLGRASRILPALNYYVAAAVLAVIVMIGGIGAYALRPESGGPSTGGTSLPAAIAQASPEAVPEKDLMQNCYSQPAAEPKDIFDIVNSAVFQTPYTTDRDPNASEPVRKPTFVGDLPAETPIGTDADATTRQAVTDAYLAFRLCSSQGFDLQVLTLFTPAGIARLLVPGGDAIDFGTITTLLNPYADQQTGRIYSDVDVLTNEIQSVQVLDDGRVVLAIEPTDPNAAFSNYHYLIFTEVDGRWLIDDLAWTPVG